MKVGQVPGGCASKGKEPPICSLVWRCSPTLGLAHSSVYVNLLARNIGSVGRCQEGHHACHFFRLPKPRKRHRSAYLIQAFLRLLLLQSSLLVNWCQGRSWADNVHTNPPPTHLHPPR